MALIFTPWRALGLLVAAGLGAGCLPLGPAPAGQRLLADGTAYDVQFVPGPTGSPSRLLTYRITSDDGQGPFSIYAVQEQAGSELDSETFLTDQVSTQNTACASANCSPPTDSLGRAFVQRMQTMTEGLGYISIENSLVRVDPASAQTVDFGSMSSLVGTFADRTGSAYTISDSLHVRDPNDDETAFEVVRDPVVVNDALYFLTPDEARGQGTVRRLTAPPFDAPETVTDGVTFFSVYQTDVPLLGLCRLQGDATACTNSVFDPATGQETPLPDDLGGVWSVSPSGRYLLAVSYPNVSTDLNNNQAILSMFDRTLASWRSVALNELDSTFWRPGHDELWFQGISVGTGQTPIPPEDQRPEFWRWVAGTDPSPILPGQGTYIAVPTDNRFWPFTPDGRFLVTASNSGSTEQPAVFLRNADDPTTPLMTLNPPGTRVADIRQLPDGRLVVADWITDISHADLYLADPGTGTLQPIGHGGKIVASGATRVLALLDWLSTGGSGSLSLIDLSTGTTMQLAQAVHAVAVDGPGTADGDLLAPGTRVAYISRNRVSSPYDGLWLTSLP